MDLKISEQLNLPEVIYHYCPLETFPQILESGALHLMHHSGMNDLTDTRLFYHNLQRAAKKKINEDNRGKIQEFLQNIEINLKDCFIACFSEEPDMLSQWHMYGDKGRGVAIGFFTNSFGLKPLIPHFSAAPGRNKGIFRIKYIDAVQDDIADQLIDSCIAGGLYAHDIPVDMMALIQKHRSFSQEKEIRIVEVQDLRLGMNPDVFGLRTSRLGDHFRYKVRAGRQIIPYRTYSFKADAEAQFQLHSIWLGPENYTSPDVIQLLLERYKTHISNGIHRSAAPFAL